MSLGGDLAIEVGEIFKARWDVNGGRVVPEPKDLLLGNHAILLDAVVLYADLADSTAMVDVQPWTFAAEVYKSYMTCAARIIRHSGGSITAYDGDRIMAVFIGNTKNTDAAKAGLRLNWALQKIVNPGIVRQYGEGKFSVNHAVGIASSQIRASRIGVRNDNDIVWVGPAANHAAKISSLPVTSPTVFITKKVYSSMMDSSKYSGQPKVDMWTLTDRLEGGEQLYSSTWISSV